LQLLVSSSRREDHCREVCNEAGARGFSACGLRKASMTRLAKAGCSVHEIQAFSGHKTLSEIAHYTSSVEQAALARKAMAKTPTKLSKNAKMRAKTTAENLDGGPGRIRTSNQTVMSEAPTLDDQENSET